MSKFYFEKKWVDKKDPVTQEDLVPADTVIGFFRKNGVCWNFKELVKALNKEQPMANWIIRSSQTEIANQGWGGRPGAQRFYKIPGPQGWQDTRAWITSEVADRIRRFQKTLRLEPALPEAYLPVIDAKGEELTGKYKSRPGRGPLVFK